MEKQDSISNDKNTQLVLAKLDELAKVMLAQHSSAALSIKQILWTNSEVADYIGVTYKYANEYIVTHHTFPHPIRLPNKHGKTGNPRWYAGEVIDWVAKYRER